MKRRNVIIASVLVLLISSCAATTRMVVLENELSISQKKEFSVSDITIEAPKKGQNVFTFEDIHTFTLPGTSTGFHTKSAVITTYTPGDAITINRADFEYYLSENSDSNFYDALSTIFSIEQPSPYTVRCKADLNYYLPKREFLSNIVGIYILLNMTIIRDSVKVFENNYEAADEEKYSTAWVTFPRNNIMNGLFNNALNNDDLPAFTDPIIAIRMPCLICICWSNVFFAVSIFTIFPFLRKAILSHNSSTSNICLNSSTQSPFNSETQLDTISGES